MSPHTFGEQVAAAIDMIARDQRPIATAEKAPGEPGRERPVEQRGHGVLALPFSEVVVNRGRWPCTRAAR